MPSQHWPHYLNALQPWLLKQLIQMHTILRFSASYITGNILLSLFNRMKQQEEVKGTYAYRHKHNYLPYSTFTITKLQLHVSAINVGHLQVVHEAINDKLYLHVSGEFTICGLGWVRDLVLCL